MTKMKMAILIARNNSARLLEPHAKRERNVVRVNVNNNIQHELAKFYLNWKLRKEGVETVTEAIFRGYHARGDVFDLDNATVCEILFSESKEEFERKESYYPRGIMLVSYDAKQLVAELIKEIKDEPKKE